jgi:branched-chain amino acid aminotransferase
MSWFNYNGKFYKDGDAIVSATNRGLRYGDGIFETMKIIDGNIIFANEHFARLWKGLQTLQFELPKHFTPEKLIEEVTALAKKNKHINAARVRLNVIRGNGGLYDAVNYTPNYIIETWPLPENARMLNTNGLVVGLYTAATKNCDVLSSLKHNNYLVYVLAALHAKKQKWNDAIVLNNNGSICESTIANIFIVKDDIVYTPPLAQGCVAGIIRQQLIEFLKANDYSIKQTPLTLAQVQTADELFLTNATYNIRWVKEFGDSTYTNILTQKIYASFLKTILPQ